jgi:hypothetical protein
MVSGVHIAANPLRACPLAAFCRRAELDREFYAVSASGDAAEMATELADLVLAELRRPWPASVRCKSRKSSEWTPRAADCHRV